MPGTVALHTLGCKLNFSETSSIGREFMEHGFQVVDFSLPSDVYVINTCTVTATAEKECRQIVRRALRNNPDACVIVTGCYAQLRPDEIVAIEGVDYVLGTKEKFQLFSIIKDLKKQSLACVYVSPKDDLAGSFGFASSTDADSRTRAFFKIQDGCDYKCSFCTIPLARGASRSFHPDQAVDAFRQILDEGYKEIILTGVNVGDYGKALDTSLIRLIEKLLKIDGEYRLRISSIEPNLLTDEIITLTRDSEKMAKHFHIPLQSGSEKVLKLMQRRYNAAFYGELIHKVAETVPGCAIGVDVIVGSPGETEEDFLETHRFIEALPVSYLHAFTYSERPDTKALTIEGKVDVVEKKKRNAILRMLSEKKKYAFQTKEVGTEQIVLFEHKAEDGMIRGFTSNYMRVVHPYVNAWENQFVPVVITSASPDIVTAKAITQV